MGSCISKCRPKKSKLEDHDHDQDHVQEKLMVISQITPKTTTQIFPLVINPNKFVSPSKTPPSPSPSSSSSSVSSFITCTASKASVSSLSSSSMSSSANSSAISRTANKDYKPSFSNEFLWSCYKENPHVVRINSLKEKKPSTAVSTTSKQTCPQKRVRSNSPINNTSTLTRQKSFRRDQLCPRDYYYNHNISTLRSPSPSRRFGNNNGERLLECHSKRSSPGSSIGYYHNYSTLFSRRENPRPPSPSCSNSSRLSRPCLRSTTTREQRNVHRVGSKIDEIAVAEALASHEIDNFSIEDIDNPLISLDCFIFI